MKTAAKTTTNHGKEVKEVNRNAPATELARRIYAAVKAKLEGEIEGFVQNSTIEEKRLLIDILEDHASARRGDDLRSPGEYEVTLYSSIERQATCGTACLVLPDERMVPVVEDFIATLERRHWQPKATDRLNRPTADEIRDGLEASFRSEYELFAKSAGRPSLILMGHILARWNELHRDPELKALPNVLEVAAEIELAKLRVETAADNAKAA